MTALGSDTDDLAVITGPLRVDGHDDVFLQRGETVRIIRIEDTAALVWGYESELHQYIDRDSLSPLVDYSEIHDYVYEGDE